MSGLKRIGTRFIQKKLKLTPKRKGKVQYSFTVFPIYYVDVNNVFPINLM